MLHTSTLKSSIIKRFSGLQSWKILKRHRSVNPLRKNGEIGFAGYALAIIPLTTFGLGTWQVQRRKWKLNLIKALEERTTASPVDLPDDLEEIENLEYCRVKVRGKFDHSKEMYISPRTLLDPKSQEGGGRLISSVHTGSLVVTPFILSDRDATVLVNRGWVPKKKTFPESRYEGQIEEEVDLIGIVRSSEKRPPFGAKNDSASKFWHFRDVDLMAERSGCKPIFIDAVKETSVHGGPIGGQTNVYLRNEHLSYIFTWYILSITTAFLWYRRFLLKIPLM